MSTQLQLNDDDDDDDTTNNNKYNNLKIKIPSKSFGRQRCAEGFNSGAKGLTGTV
jgi:hypothetical protein